MFSSLFKLQLRFITKIIVFQFNVPKRKYILYKILFKYKYVLT
jgi:hypothetical protein